LLFRDDTYDEQTFCNSTVVHSVCGKVWILKIICGKKRVISKQFLR